MITIVGLSVAPVMALRINAALLTPHSAATSAKVAYYSLVSRVFTVIFRWGVLYFFGMGEMISFWNKRILKMSKQAGRQISWVWGRHSPTRFRGAKMSVERILGPW